jgi:hypothetical protein
VRPRAKTIYEHLHEHSKTWWNWLGKRWTRILRGRADGARPRD